MSSNAFQPKKYEDFVIIGPDSKIVGHVRVKPSGIAWSPKGGKVWYRVHLEQFAAFMINEGERTTK